MIVLARGTVGIFLQSTACTDSMCTKHRQNHQMFCSHLRIHTVSLWWMVAVVVIFRHHNYGKYILRNWAPENHPHVAARSREDPDNVNHSRPSYMYNIPEVTYQTTGWARISGSRGSPISETFRIISQSVLWLSAVLGLRFRMISLKLGESRQRSLIFSAPSQNSSGFGFRITRVSISSPP